MESGRGFAAPSGKMPPAETGGGVGRASAGYRFVVVGARHRILAVAAVVASVAIQFGGPVRAEEPLEAQQWSLEAMHVRGAWALARGAGAVVAIVDSGIDLDHPDLAGRLLPGRTFLNCGDAGCGNGDWEDGSGATAADDHGTHIAGIVAAVADNGQGIAGIAPEARLLPVKSVDVNGGSTADVASGIHWAADQGADVINLSLSTGPGDEAQQEAGIETDVGEAVVYAHSRDVVVVAAAGNSGLPVCERPAYEPYVLCVSATDKRGARSGFSSAPVKPEQLAVSAPGGSGAVACGEGVLSTVPVANPPACGYPAGCGEMSGTSMATAQVAGLAALLAGNGHGRQTILDAITSSARNPTTGERGTYSPTFGHGIVDAQAAVLTPEVTVAPPGSNNAVGRFAGSDRIDTAIAISKVGFGTRQAAAVVLSRHDGFADALAGSPLAAAVDGPVLLSPTAGLDARTENEIRRVLPGGGPVHVLGGTAALSDAVSTRIEAAGYRVVRYAGADRFETAVLVAEQGLGAPANVMLATGTRHEDALIAAPAAHAQRAAVLLTAGTQRDPLTSAYLARHPSGEHIAVGPEAVAAHPEAEAISGPDPPSTARRVADRFFPGPPTVILARHATFPDALAGGAYAAMARAPLLLCEQTVVPPPIEEFMVRERESITGGAVLGGPAAVDEAVRLRTEDLIA